MWPVSGKERELNLGQFTLQSSHWYTFGTENRERMELKEDKISETLTHTNRDAHSHAYRTRRFHLVSLNSPSWSIWFGLYGNENEKPLKGSKESHWIWFSSTLKIDVARQGACGCVSVSAVNILCLLFAWHYPYASIWPLTSHLIIQDWQNDSLSSPVLGKLWLNYTNY